MMFRGYRCNRASPDEETFSRTHPGVRAAIFGERSRFVAVFLSQPDSQRAAGVPMRRERGQFQWSPRFLASNAFATPCEGGIFPSMLPGFRFLFAAIVLSISILVFGLGAAALLRAAHEEFAGNPSWHAAPEPMFAQQSDVARPVLAMLRIEPSAAEQQASDNFSVAAAKSEAGSPQSTEPEQVVALKPEETPPPEAAKIPLPQDPAPSEATETRTASTGQAPPQGLSPPAEATPATSEPAETPASSAAGNAPTKPATLDEPTATLSIQPPASAEIAPPDRSAAEKREQARRAAHRRRMAARARQARLAQQAQSQQPADPFAQAFVQPPAATRH